MRTLIHTSEFTGAAAESAYSQDTRHAYAGIAAANHEDVGSLVRPSPIGSAVRMVGLLAFGQSLLFLVLWLLICASAGAAPAKNAETSTDLASISTYEPAKVRSPLSKAGLPMGDGKAAAAVSVTLQLEGILYETGHPAAIVSGHILTLNKTVTIGEPGNGGVQLKAVEITRDRALVEMGGQKIELLLNRPNGL